MRRTKLNFTVILLTLALISSALAVGTMSKYAIGGGATDKAQVAKWGVTIDIDGGNSFGTEASNMAVVSSNTHKVVAPGTDSDEFDGAMTVTLKGTPEVAFQLTIDLGTTEDVFLKNGTYPDYTAADVDNTRGTFEVNETEGYYYPVVFTFTHYWNDGAYSLAGCIGTSGVDQVVEDAYYEVPTVAGYTEAEAFTGTLAEFDKFFENISTAMACVNANYVLDDQFVLEWAWDFGDPANNQKDTMLGNFAADKVEGGTRFATAPDGVTPYVDGTDYNLELDYTFTITIEQLDVNTNY